jgi:hypothetical protein
MTEQPQAENAAVGIEEEVEEEMSLGDWTSQTEHLLDSIYDALLCRIKFAAPSSDVGKEKVDAVCEAVDEAIDAVEEAQRRLRA